MHGDKQHRQLLRKAEDLGARIEVSGGGHLKVYTPNGAVVFCARTPSDNRAAVNLRRDLRRTGGLEL